MSPTRIAKLRKSIPLLIVQFIALIELPLELHGLIFCGKFMKLKEMMLHLPPIYENGTIFCIRRRKHGRECLWEKQNVTGLILGDPRYSGKMLDRKGSCTREL